MASSEKQTVRNQVVQHGDKAKNNLCSHKNVLICKFVYSTTTTTIICFSNRLPTLMHLACAYRCEVVSSRTVSFQLEPLTRLPDLKWSSSYWAAILQEADGCPEVVNCSCGESCPRCWINFQRTHTRAPWHTHTSPPQAHLYTLTEDLLSATKPFSWIRPEAAKTNEHHESFFKCFTHTFSESYSQTGELMFLLFRI